LQGFLDVERLVLRVERILKQGRQRVALFVDKYAADLTKPDIARPRARRERVAP
jgi:hypothetical protein